MTIEHAQQQFHPTLKVTFPQARCGWCGTTKIASICCRCNRFLCAVHDDVADLSRMRRSLRLYHRPDMDAPAAHGGGTEDDHDSDNAAGNGEAGDNAEPIDDDQTVPIPGKAADAPKRTQERHFCRDCMPGRLHDPELLIATLVGLLGGLVAMRNLAIGVVLMLIGAIRITARVIRWIPRWAGRRNTALFLDPRITELKMVETISGRAQLDASHRYSRTVADVSGTIQVKALWANSQAERVADHRRRHRIPDSHDLEIRSGAFVVRGPGRLQFHADGIGKLAHPTTVLLRPRTGDHAFLRSPDGRGDSNWAFEIAYDIAVPDRWRLPVCILPAISPGSDGRALDLEVQWRTCEPDKETAQRESALESKSIEKLRIFVPVEWGDVVSNSEAELVTIGPPIDGRRCVEWQRPPVERTCRGRCHLSVAFEQPIKSVGSVTGELDMRFHRLLSSARLVQVHAAGGARRQDGARCAVETRVRLDFDLSLAGVRYQNVRAVPDPVKDADEPRPERLTFRGVVPDPYTVAHLTNILSSEGYYLKRIVENPPQPGYAAGTLNRFWDIAGRHYNGVHPIDFHLVITGEEVEAGATGIPMTTVRLAVRGTYATHEMEQRIVLEQQLLWRRIVSSLLSTTSGVDGGGPRELEEPIDKASAEVARLRNVALSLRNHLLAAQRSGDITDDLAAELIIRIDEEFGLDGLNGQMQ